MMVLGCFLGLLIFDSLVHAWTMTVLLMAGIFMRAIAGLLPVSRPRFWVWCAFYLGIGDYPEQVTVHEGRETITEEESSRRQDEDFAAECLRVYEILCRALFEGSGLRSLSYLKLAFLFLLGTAIRGVLAFLDWLGIMPLWTSCSTEHASMQSCLCQCFRQALQVGPQSGNERWEHMDVL